MRGRPPIPEEKRKKTVTLRLTPELYELMRANGGPVAVVEQAVPFWLEHSVRLAEADKSSTP
ncbi:MAG: hypothetical protein RL661_900 [Pseudomonadota bacterium]|jgi:hypothetical protein